VCTDVVIVVVAAAVVDGATKLPFNFSIKTTQPAAVSTAEYSRVSFS